MTDKKDVNQWILDIAFRINIFTRLTGGGYSGSMSIRRRRNNAVKIIICKAIVGKKQ